MHEERWEFFRAADEGRVGDLREFVRRGMDVNISGLLHNNALARAVQAGHREAVVTLLELGANPNDLGSRGWSAVTFAARYHPELLPILEEAGGRVDLFEAVLLGDLDRARRCAEEDLRGPSDRAVAHYCASLIAATEAGRIDLASFLLERRPDPSLLESPDPLFPSPRATIEPYDFDHDRFQGYWTMSPPTVARAETEALTVAALAGNRALAELLISAGATRTLLDAVALGDMAAVQSLLRDDRGEWDQSDPQFAELAAARGHDEIVHRLVEAGFSRGQVDPEGRSWAYLDGWFAAARAGDCGALDAMIRAGANLDAWASEPLQGMTALMMAVWEGHREAVRLLIDRGADVGRARPGGWTAISHAVHFHRELIPMLEAAGGVIPSARRSRSGTSNGSDDSAMRVRTSMTTPTGFSMTPSSLSLPAMETSTWFACSSTAARASSGRMTSGRRR